MYYSNAFHMKKLILVMAALASTAAIYGKRPDTRTVDDYDINRYMGTWYEIARFDTYFEYEMDNVTTSYALNDDGTISVHNQGYRNGKPRSIKGRAKIKDIASPGKFRISFLKWIYDDYYLLELDKINYSYAMIGSSSPKSLWILSRTPTMSNRDINYLLRAAKARGYDLRNLIFCDQHRSINKCRELLGNNHLE